MQNAALPDEVVEVFTGDTLEEAMAYAVASLGPDLTVRRARRVRKGVQGLRGKDRYEVVAVPAPRVSTDVVGNAFEALLQEAEGLEESVTPLAVRRTTRPASPTVAPAVLESVPDVIQVLAPVPVPQPRRAEAPARRVPTKAPAVHRTAPASRRTTAPSGWSRPALRRLGVPAAVLRALPAKDPRGDVAWIAALTKAFAEVVPAAGDDAVVVSGRGIEGVRGIVAAARSGIAPGTITYDGRTARATATELALAVRSELLA